MYKTIKQNSNVFPKMSPLFLIQLFILCLHSSLFLLPVFALKEAPGYKRDSYAVYVVSDEE